MTSTTVILIVLAVVILAIVAAVLLQRRTLRRRFGHEYDRLVEEYHSRPKAERELLSRRRKHASLTLRTLPDAARIRYARAWQGIESQFIDDPRVAVTEADALFTDLLTEIGFPAGDYDQRVSALSVDHAPLLEHYREAHDVGRHGDQASTEQLRQALVHYRLLFAEFLGHEHFSDEPALSGAPATETDPPASAGRPRPAVPEREAARGYREDDGSADPIREPRRTS